jgi:hypothetical protein
MVTLELELSLPSASGLVRACLLFQFQPLYLVAPILPLYLRRPLSSRPFLSPSLLRWLHSRIRRLPLLDLVFFGGHGLDVATVPCSSGFIPPLTGAAEKGEKIRSSPCVAACLLSPSNVITGMLGISGC